MNEMYNQTGLLLTGENLPEIAFSTGLTVETTSCLKEAEGLAMKLTSAGF